VPALHGVRCSPSPARAGDAITLRFVLAQQGHASVRVLDVSGRLVRTLALPSASPGEQAISWDTLDQSGRRVRPGLYLVRVDGPGTQTNGRAVVVQ
jgi:flagellar hook assembly protein FlgD